MKYRIDNLQYCNWSRDIFQINREANLDAVHVTLVYHEDYDEFVQRTKEWDKLFNENSDLIFYFLWAHLKLAMKLKTQSFQANEQTHLLQQ